MQIQTGGGVAICHAEALARIRSLASAITPADVAHAFVSSLGSRQLELRSALASFAVARVLPEHELVPAHGAYATICCVCGWHKMPAGEEQPPSHLDGERPAFGGVRHRDPEYIEFDLSEFVKLPRAIPNAADWACLKEILQAPSQLEASAKAADLERALKSVFRSNKNERRVLIQILACAGILEAEGHPSFFERFVPGEARDLPAQRFADWGYPTIWWRAKHGVRADAISFWFPEVA